MAQKQYKKGDVIFRQGDFGNTMYEVKSGTVGIFAKYGTPREKKLTELSQGRVFGEMAVIEVYPRSATAVALEDVTAQEVSVSELREYFENSPDKLLEIMRGQTRRLRELTADYEEVRRTLGTWQAEDVKGAKKSSGLLGSLKKFAAIFAESMQHVNTTNAGVNSGVSHSPTRSGSL